MTYHEAAAWVTKEMGIEIKDWRLRAAAAAGHLTVIRLGHRTVQITEKCLRNYIARRTRKAIGEHD